MYKAVVLVATLCATLALASDRDTKINNRFALTVARRDALRQKHGLGVYAKKRLTQEDWETPGDETETLGFIDCAKGLAQGLQFSSS